MIGLGDPDLGLGVLFYAVAMVTERVAPVKITDFLILIAMFVYGRPSASLSIRRSVGWDLAILFLLVSWCILAGSLSGFEVSSALKTAFRFLLLFLLPILICLLVNKQNFVNVMVGMLLGSWCYFAGVFSMELIGIDTGYVFPGEDLGASIDPSNTNLIKWVITPPVVLLAVLLICWEGFDAGLRRLWIFATATSMIASVFLESRTSVAVLLLSIGFFVACRLISSIDSRLIPVLAAAVCVGIPVLPLFGPAVVDWLGDEAAVAASPSNAERLYMISVALDWIGQRPIFGNGWLDFHALYGPNFELMFGYQAVVDNPHNIYLDLGLSFGIPAAVLFAVLVGRLASHAVKTIDFDVILALSAITTFYAILPLAKEARLMTTVLWMLVLAQATADPPVVQQTPRRRSLGNFWRR
jgi:hypothetical protein